MESPELSPSTSGGREWPAALTLYQPGRLARRLALALLALLALAAGLRPAAPARAAFPGTNGLIAFTSTRDGNGEIYVMNADGSGLLNLTNHAAIDEQPAWSADGTRITFTSDRDGNTEVYVMNADGSSPINLTNNPASDGFSAWSPDGTQIVFSSLRDGNWEVYTMNADGSSPTNLTNNPALDGDASWSPDGTRIAFDSLRDGNGEIYLMNADGSGLTNLTNNLAWDTHPNWSPDGTQIAFSSTRAGNWEVYVMNADGSGPTRLTNATGLDLFPAWSPDGTQITFSSTRDGNTEVYVMNADGSGQIKLTTHAALDDYPDWQPLLPDVFMSARTAGVTGDGLAFGPHDVLRYDGSAWSKFFDGDFAGLTPNGKAKHNVNAVWIPDPHASDAVMSFGQNSRHVPGITGKVDGMDLVWYDANANTFSLWFDGNDVDLTNKTQEKIDALHVLPGGGPCLYNILISTQGPGRVSNQGEDAIIFSGEDVLNFCATNLGEATAGEWSLLLDGSEQGMPKNSTTSISVSDDGQTMYLTTRSTFNVDGAFGGSSMVYAYDFGTTEFGGPYFSAAAEGLPGYVDGLHIMALP